MEIDPITGKEMYRCDKCDMRFDTVAKIEQHNEWHEVGKEKSEKCFICEKEFDHKNILAKHMKDNHRNRRGRIQMSSMLKNFQVVSKIRIPSD